MHNCIYTTVWMKMMEHMMKHKCICAGEVHFQGSDRGFKSTTGSRLQEQRETTAAS